MKIHSLVLGATITAAMLVAGCDKNETATTDEMNSGVEMNSTDMNATEMPAPTADADTTVGTEIDDGVITTKVKSALLADDTVKGLDIDVDTTQGTVRLSGMVDSQTQIDMAVQIAQGVEGVSNVQNELTVKQ